MKFILLLLTVGIHAWAVEFESIPNYYGNEFKSAYSKNQLSDEGLKEALFKIISSGHVKNENAPDEIVPSCESYYSPITKFPYEMPTPPTAADTEPAPIAKPVETPINPPSMNAATVLFPEVENPKFPPDGFEPSPRPGKCVQHRSLGYEPARRKLFGWIYLKQRSNGEYFVRDVYCEKEFSDADFNGEKTFGPGLLPKSGNIINTEHTWPQSRFTGRFPREMQKSDLHHLYPTDSEMNGRRGSLRFGFVVEEVEKTKCPQNKVGHQAAGGIIFEVPDSQKGNTARAIFYFATRYQMKISPPEEEALRIWNESDPIDEEERMRNDQIEEVQGNRNPFIDIPDLLKRISHF